MNGAAVNMSAHVFVQIPIFSSFGCVPGSGIAGSYDNSVFTVLRNCKTALQQLNSFIFPQAMYKNFNFSMSSPTLVTVCL